MSADVDLDDVWVQFGGQSDRFLPISCLAHDLHVIFPLQQFTSALTDEYVVTVGPKCHVLCVDASSGEFRWGIDLVREFGTQEPLWFTAQCPLIDGSRAILAPIQ